MKCIKCNNELQEGSLFCNACGAKVENNTNKKIDLNFSKQQKTLIISLLSIFVILLLIVAVLVTNIGGNSVFKDNTRTIMIYLDGTNLESNGGIASADIDAINPSSVDLKKTNVLVYTGGTEKWFNYIKNDENAIYKLTSSGFEKIETYPQLDMADPDTLASFLKYSYDNYKAGHMDLVLYDHGGAIIGAISDDFSGNTMSLPGFKEALKKSPFDKNNKLELIAFRTCLNGTIENANTFKDFSEYLVASEEVTYGSKVSNVLGYFVNNVKPSDNGIDVGKKFIDAYNRNIDEICYFPDEFLVTYAVIDLSKVDRLTQEFEKLISGINIKTSFSSISRIRSNMLQFAANGSNNTTDFDTVDMYDLIKKLNDNSLVDSKDFEKIFNETIAYYYTNNPEDTHGLSVYLPYRASKKVRDYLVKTYGTFDFMSEYGKFVSNFNSLLNGESPKAFSFADSSVNVDDSKEVTLVLSDDQKDNYTKARYLLFRKDSENPEFFEYIMSSDDVDTSEAGKIKTKIGNTLVKVYDDENNSAYVHISRRKSGNKFVDTHNGILYNKNAGDFGKMDNAEISIVNDSGKPKFGDVIITGSRDQRYDGIVRNINDYTTIDIFKLKYKILDSNGNILPSDDWETPGQMNGIELRDFETNDINSEIDLRYTGLDDGEFYCLFILFDMNNVGHYDKLIKVGE